MTPKRPYRVQPCLHPTPTNSEIPVRKINYNIIGNTEFWSFFVTQLKIPLPSAFAYDLNKLLLS